VVHRIIFGDEKEVMELLGKKERLEAEYGPKTMEVEKRLSNALDIVKIWIGA
jgi:hypothetical protein